jgi:hypothetical protein
MLIDIMLSEEHYAECHYAEGHGAILKAFPEMFFLRNEKEDEN